MGTQYRLYNGHMPTTGGPPAGVVTSATLFTQLQIVTAAGFPGEVIEWGVSFNGAALVAGFPCALITTGAIAATVTAFAAADAMPYCDPNAPANTTAGSTSYPFNMSTATSGFTSSAEGSISATRLMDHALVEPIGGYFKQFPLGLQPGIAPAEVLRVMVLGDGTTKVTAYVVIEV
jgi:hypothetical protein